MTGEGKDDRVAAVLEAWAEPTSPAGALAYRALAQAVTGVPFPLPIEPDEVERHVAVARRNREYSAAHTDAMLPLDPPLLPGLLARAEALDARERAAFADRVAEREHRLAAGEDAAAALDLRLAACVRAAVFALPRSQASVLCLRHGLSGDRPRRPDEVARALGIAFQAARGLEADGLEALREAAREPAFRGVLDAAAAASPRPLSLTQTPSPPPLGGPE